MKIVYLDQNHWIELSRAAYKRDPQPETPAVLTALRAARTSRDACFPLSLGHYIETLKRQAPDSRERLAAFMLALSDGITVAPPHVVVRHELEQALAHYFPNRVRPEPLQFLGLGLSHAADADFGFHLEWPSEAEAISAPQRAAFESLVLSMATQSLLSGVLPTGDPLNLGPATDLTPERRFKAGLEEWRGAASTYSAKELERRIHATTLADISSPLLNALTRHGIPAQEFALLGDSQWYVLLDSMPSRTADMHIRRQWAKNANLVPKDSDLNDWAYLGVAVSYCDIVVTEKQMADLFSRGFSTRAKIVARLVEVPDLLA